jgi:hypothetical protein
MAITFEVSNVPRYPVALRIPSAPPRVLQGLPVEAMGAASPAFLPSAENAFLRAAHVAYALHYPLTLTPDAVWLCIAQGFAAHVNLNAERLRGRFVRHEGQATIKIRRDDFVQGSPQNPWPEVFGAFSDAVAEHIGKKRDLLVCDFSTTGPHERAASEVVLLDTVQRFFKYELYTLCGIPEITLEGTVADWRALRRRAQALEEYDAAFWTKELGPVLDKVVATAEGKVDREFWEMFFKHADGSGGPWVRGWINVLFPYVSELMKETLAPNPALGVWRRGIDSRHGGGPRPGQIPSGISSVPFVWEYLGARVDMRLLAGFVGAAQDPESLALRPVIGWAVREDGPPPPPPTREEMFEEARESSGLPVGATLMAGWISAPRWLTASEIRAVMARVEDASREHGSPLDLAVAADHQHAYAFPEAPLSVRLAVGVRLGSAELRGSESVGPAAALRALHKAKQAPRAIREALEAIFPFGMDREPAIHLLAAGSHLRASLVDATGRSLAEASTHGPVAASLTLAPKASTELTLRADFAPG